MKINNKKLISDIKNNKFISINLGSGNENLNNYYNFDINDYENTDAVCDLNENLDQIPDNIVEKIYSNQTLEHITNLDGLMKELVRISVNNAEYTLIVPHFSNPYYYSDPTHVRQFGLFTMHYFIDSKQQWRRKVPSYSLIKEFYLDDVNILFYRDTILEHIFNPFIEKFVNLNRFTQHFFEKRLCWIYPSANIKYIIKIKK